MKALKFLFSGKLMGILLVIFAMSIGYATFIENDFDAATAKLLIYNARWFEWIMMLMIINFAGMIFTKKLYRKSKINILLMHTSLIIIIVGAGVTRYFGFEGQMHIREGQTSNKIVTYDDYVNLNAVDNDKSEQIYKKVVLSTLNKSIFNEDITLGNKDIEISIDRFLPNATPVLEESADGEPVLSLVTSGMTGRQNIFVRNNEIEKVESFSFSLGESAPVAHVQFLSADSGLVFRSIMPIQPTDMGKPIGEALPANTFHKLEVMKLYKIGNLSFIITDFLKKGALKYAPVNDPNQKGSNIIFMTFKSGDKSKHFMAREGKVDEFTFNDVKFTMNIGSQTYTIPFTLKLNKFELDRYPGSMSPSSFASEITLIDKKKNINRPFRIFMNNILDYGGYRFYQSSYDKDEKGTVLSVNHDKWGTWITYFGYFLLFGTLIASLLTKKTRFARLNKQINDIHVERKKLALSLILLLIPVFLSAQPVNEVDKEHAGKFGQLMVQNKDGRIIPLNTLSTSSLVKIYKKSAYEGLSSEQVLLGIITSPDEWKKQPIIKIYDEAVSDIVGVKGNFASFYDFFDAKGDYILRKNIDEIYAKSPSKRSKLDKEIIAVDERINVLYMLLRGDLLKIFPKPNDANNKWLSPSEFSRMDSSSILADYIKYLGEVTNAGKSGNYQNADNLLKKISDNQYLYGKEIIPSSTKLRLEILYNNLNIFKKLFPIFMTLGLVLLGLFLIQLFIPSLEFKNIVNVLYLLLFISFIAQTFGLGLRWYISGHAPWSNGYESMIYIAWATVLAGFIFLKKSPMTLAATSILAGITLLTAHMSWLNPEITNLVPVLKSYWLTFHVATITASYGFLALGSILGFINLGIMIFRNKDNHERVNLTLKELTLTIEMSLMVGLILLVIGNFLGGIWANESWGRYWGWDPKETWSLVTIIVYSFILHTRLIPGIKSMFSTNFLALIGFGSVLMTYFGVNYYLSGLHSYAQGDPVPIPTFVYYLLAAIAIVSVLALMNEISLRKKIAMTSDVILDEELE